MKEGYQYDLFISYSHKSPVLPWVSLYFKPTLEERIRCQLPFNPSIFVDYSSIEEGSKWPEKIKEALRTTKVMILIWSADYFQKEWCVAEWITMEERQKQINKKANSSPSILFPIKFIYEDYFPDLAKKTQMEDLIEYNYTGLNFKETEKFLDFEKKVEAIARNLCRIILNVPPWDPHWQIYLPDSQKVKKIKNQCQFKLNRPRM